MTCRIMFFLKDDMSFLINYKDRFDPTQQRSPWCPHLHVLLHPCGFNSLFANYLEITDTDHPLISKINEIMQNVLVNPAYVGEQLLKNEDPEIALKGVIECKDDGRL